MVVGCDLLQFLVLTGMRRNEAASLTWDDVSREDGYVIVKGEIAKNHAPHQLPLSDYLQKLIGKRWRERTNQYVFPSLDLKGVPQHLKPSLYTARRITKLCGVKFTNHDLRRTFISIAEYLNINQYAIKRMVNHKFHKSDETADYISTKFDTQRLRGPMQQVTDFILDQAGLRKTETEKSRITIDLEPEHVCALKTGAEIKGLTLNQYVQSLLIREAPSIQNETNMNS